MVYIVDNKKYSHGERTPKQTSLSIIKVKYHHLTDKYIFRSNLAENHMLFFVESGHILLNNQKIEKGNIIYISRFEKFSFNTCDSTSLVEITFDYSESITLFDNKIRIIKAPLDVQECVRKIYYNTFFCNLLSGVNEGLLLNTLNTLNIMCNSRSGELSLYQKCLEWIEQSPTYSITAESAARAMSCTAAHLNRTIRKHSGKCLSTIITERKITEIKRLLKTSDLSTDDIALRLDFNSSELLRKFFKYHTGISLKEYKSAPY